MVYGGSKAYLLALTQALTKELNDNGVTIQAVLPGATRTEIWERAGARCDAGCPRASGGMADDDARAEGIVDMTSASAVPLLPITGSPADAEAARLKMSPNLSHKHAAARYR